MKVRAINQQQAFDKRWEWILLRIDHFEGDQIPKWYRRAYLEATRDVDVYSPIGLHLIIRWIHRFWR